MLLLTRSLSVLTVGGSNNLWIAATNTKKEITTKNTPFTKPERISTRPNLRKIDNLNLINDKYFNTKNNVAILIY